MAIKEPILQRAASEQLSFINRNELEIRLTADPDLLAAVQAINPDQITTPQVTSIRAVVDSSRTILSIYQKPQRLGAKVLLSSNDPGSYDNATKRIASELIEDPRCKTIGFLTSGLSTQRLYDDFGDRFTPTTTRSRGTLYALLASSADKPYDVVLASVSSANGPEVPLLFGGKSNLGASKLFYIAEGWSEPGGAFTLNRANMDPIDGLFCNDLRSQRILQHHLPEVPGHRFIPIGTPALDTLENERAEDYRQTGRTKMGLTEDTWAFLFVGQPSSDKSFVNADPRIQEKTLEHTLKGFGEFASYHPGQKLAFLLRTHPRDPEINAIIKILNDAELPDNVSRIVTNHPGVKMQEAAFGTDSLGSIHSTEAFLGPFRGIPTLFLAYQDRGLGRDDMLLRFGSGVFNEIQNDPTAALVGTPAEFTRAIEDAYQRRYEPRQRELVGINYARGIVNVMLAA